MRLYGVERVFNSEQWEHGASLLAAIGAPAWSADRIEPPLFAWELDNCRRSAVAWVRLVGWHKTQLPCDLRPLLKLHELPPIPNVPTVVPLVHKGFPDGDFTRCGLDRHTLNVAVAATMDTRSVTCDPCGSKVHSPVQIARIGYRDV